MSAFTKLVFARGFENISVREIVASADVARSTFYEHFSSREDVLRACMSRFFGVIAQCVSSDTVPGDLRKVLDHLWENRRLTDAIFSGSPRVILARSLAGMVEAQLRQMASGQALSLPYPLAGIHLAEGQLALVEGWMRGRAYCSPDGLAQALHKSSRSSALTLLQPQ